MWVSVHLTQCLVPSRPFVNVPLALDPQECVLSESREERLEQRVGASLVAAVL